jgi:hypothetical protein
MSRLRPLLLCLALTSSLFAQDAPPEGVVLLPITKTEVPGANGSLWVTELYLHNHSDQVLWVTNTWGGCRLSAVHACDVRLDPRSTVRETSTPPQFPRNDAYHYWYVTEGAPSAFSASTFVRNIGTDVDPWGTAVPAARAADFKTEPLHLAPVPGDPAYRVSLRVYVWSWFTHSSELAVEIWTTGGSGNAPSLVRSLTLPAVPKQYADAPGSYFEAHDIFAGIPARGASDRFTIRMATPASPGARLWGFASIVHNETQHVTVFAP